VYQGNDSVERYVSALIQEIRLSRHESSPIDTVYFGGGTPSLLSPVQLKKIVQALSDAFDFCNSLEFTLEMNPATVTLKNLEDFKSIGVNRASFGVQTFDDRALKILARGHDSNDARQTNELLSKAGFENISFDLIAGLPNQTLDDWASNLDEAIKLDPKHLSLYILEIHESTPLAEQIRTKRQPLPDDDLAGEMYKLMQARLADAGYLQYEISNFAKPGYESKHNNKYWQMKPVFGFGVSAHSFDGIQRRWSNERDTNKYVELVEAGQSAIATDETLDRMQLSGEFAFLNLRLKDGLSVSEYKKRFGIDILKEYSDELLRLKNLGFIAISDTSIVLTEKGMLFSNEVFEVFV
jgi:oxygen-independent coproporphyrinogen-3 oxidase